MTYIFKVSSIILSYFYVKMSVGVNLTEIRNHPGFHLVDQKIMGDLYQLRRLNIYSLAWTVQLTQRCDIQSVIQAAKRHYYSGAIKSQLLSKICDTKFMRLIIVKKFKQFHRTYILAHPYLRLYNKIKKKIKNAYNLYIMRMLNLQSNSTNTYSSRKFTESNYLSDSEVFNKIEMCIEDYFKHNPCVKLASQEVLRPREKRGEVVFSDPLFKDQWHLKNTAVGEYDINIFGAWESGITGRGITVCVVDDGLEWKHPDLQDNYNPRGSYDLNADDPDPTPVRNGGKNEHGTRCAGEIAAVTNSVCGVGVAYRANISGIRVLGDRMTDSMEASAFIEGLGVNDIYSCSWGPNDDGKTIDGPHNLAKKALVHGVTYGRDGYGAIYVVASGNGGKNKDNCNFDGYANSVYTVTIGAVDSRGTMPYYAEECATMLAVTPSSGSNGKAIVTTDWQGSSESGCTWQHSGTSAAAPLAAAVIALALEMQPCLSWRDVQYLIALTSRKIDVLNSDWIVNQAGLHHSHQHGFGLMDATGIVSAAAVWESVPFSTSYRSNILNENESIPSRAWQKLIVNHTVAEDILIGYALYLLEVVQVYITLEHEYRGSLKISLTCPSGTTSILASPRIKDNSTQGLQYWPLGTVRCWGEVPWGTYSLAIEQTHKRNLTGSLKSWQLALHGSPLTGEEFSRRKRLVRRAMKGDFVHVNRSQLCHLPEVNFEPLSVLSEQALKILVIIGVFLLIMSVYNTMEYLLCYNREKKLFYQYLKDIAKSQTLNRMSGTTPRTSSGDTSHFEAEFPDNQESQSLMSVTANYESVPMMEVSRNGTVSPTLSCEADISSLNGDSDDIDDGDTISSRNTSDTVVPKDTTDFTTTTTELTTDFASDPEEDNRCLEAKIC